MSEGLGRGQGHQEPDGWAETRGQVPPVTPKAFFSTEVQTRPAPPARGPPAELPLPRGCWKDFRSPGLSLGGGRPRPVGFLALANVEASHLEALKTGMPVFTGVRTEGKFGH